MIRSKSDSLTGAFFRYGGEPGMQEKRECRRTGYAGMRMGRRTGYAGRVDCRGSRGVILQIVNLVEVRTAQGRRRYGK